MKNKTLILVIEDEKGISSFITAKLEVAGYRTIAAFNASDAISQAASRCPDLILLDLGLPDMDGLEVLAAIRGWSAMPIIVISARKQESDIVMALDNGADDYVTKPFSNPVLLARIRTVLRKNIMLETKQPQMLQSFNAGSLIIDYSKRQVTVNNQQVHLTPIEYKMLSLLARNAGEVVTYKVVRKELWGPYLGDSNVLRVNMANLRRKIEQNSADPKYIITEMGIGYRMMESDEAFKKPDAPYGIQN